LNNKTRNNNSSRNIATAAALGEDEPRGSNNHPSHQVYHQDNIPPYILDREIEKVSAGLSTGFSRMLRSIPEKNALTTVDYILAMEIEINLSDNYRRDIIKLVTRFSKFHNNKSLKLITREDILTFLGSFRRPEASDPLHKWIGTYNIFLIHLIRFYKWLYYPDIEPDKRQKPEVVQNISRLKRK
jgi:hypothetical protein